MAERWRESLAHINKNSISRLQEYAAKRGFEVRYNTYPSQEGFKCDVYFQKAIASGTGNRKKEAEEATADRALRSLYSETNQPPSYQQSQDSSPEIIYSRQSSSSSNIYSDEEDNDSDKSCSSDVELTRCTSLNKYISNRRAPETAWDLLTSGRSQTNYTPMLAGGKNPISLFMEHAQAKKEQGRFEVESKSGPSHAPTFTVRAVLGKRSLATGTGSSKKRAKLIAAEKSLNMVAPRPSPRALLWPGVPLPHSPPVIDKNAGLCPAGADPISILNEYAQKKGVELTFPDPEESGADHQKMFTICAMLDNIIYPRASASTIREAKREASREALRKLKQRRVYQFTSGSFTFPISEPLTFHDRIAKLCHEKFNTVVADIPENLAGRKVIAGIVMETKATRTFEVISIASGNRFIKGDALTTDGHVLVDSHAEILAVRGMRKFLYSHVTKLTKGEKSNVLQRFEGKKAELCPGIQFHLYISTAPCGDGAIFTHSAGHSEDERSGSHHPIFDDNKQGLLRTKVEQGEGQIPTKKIGESHQYQAMDSLRHGERLRVMSCSDKICKWNLLGMQGALLATLMKPLYFNSITFGALYHHGHMARALCCRLEKSCQIASLPEGYKVNHPLLGAVSGTNSPQRSVEKSTAFCINWNLASADAELTDGTTGVPRVSRGIVDAKTDSRLCKQRMLQSYKKICETIGFLELVKDDYLATKKGSKQYQRCKKFLYESFHNQGYGTWIGLPRECQEFPSFSNDHFIPSFLGQRTSSGIRIMYC